MKLSSHHQQAVAEIASAEDHSLQMATKEFHKIREPKIQKLKGPYLANTLLIFNSC